MADDCDHDLPRRAAGLDEGAEARLAAARAEIARLGEPPELEGRRALAGALAVVVEIEVALAALALGRGAPEAEAALRRLHAVVGGDRDPALRGALGRALLAVGQARRAAAPPADKVAAEVQAVEAAIALGELEPPLAALVAEGLVRLVRSGQFQTDPAVRGRAFAAGRELCARFGETDDAEVGRAVARGIDELARMMRRDDPERAALLERQAALGRRLGR